MVKFKPDYKKLRVGPKFRKITVCTFVVEQTFSTFGAVIEQLSLAIEIMVKCSHALNWS